jgi:long-chain fatty acid transport protein
MKTRFRDRSVAALPRFFLFTLGAAGVSVLAAGDAFAAGIALDVQSARGTGMAGAQTAMVDDSAAIFYNPAGIARGKGFDAQVGVSLIAPTFSYTSPAGHETTMPFNVVPPFTAYVAGGLTDNISLGIGVFTPYGLRIDWGDTNWDGRRFLTKAGLETYDFNPTAAATFGPVRFGAGFQLMRAVVHLQRQVGFGSQEGSVDLGGSAWGVGANVGAQVDAYKKFLTFGVHYRSAIKTDFDDGKVAFSNVPTSLQGTIHDQAASTSLTNPDQLAFGIASQPIEALTLDVDVIWLGWGKFHAIDLHFPDDKTGTLDSHEPKNWSSGFNYHLGGEGKINENIRVRAGVLYDPSPSPEDTLLPDLPDADRLNLAIGGSYIHSSGFRVELGYQHLILFSHKSTAPQFPGDYGGAANILGISIGYGTPAKKKDANPAPTDNVEPVNPPPPDGTTTPAPDTTSTTPPSP